MRRRAGSRREVEAVTTLNPVAAFSRRCFLAEARRGLHARNHRCRPRYLQRRYARRCSDSCRCTPNRSEEHTSELQSRQYLVCRLLLEKKKKEITSELT